MMTKEYAKMYLITNLQGVQHIAIECCPRNGDMTTPSERENIRRVYNLEENRL